MAAPDRRVRSFGKIEFGFGDIDTNHTFKFHFGGIPSLQIRARRKFHSALAAVRAFSKRPTTIQLITISAEPDRRGVDLSSAAVSVTASLRSAATETAWVFSGIDWLSDKIQRGPERAVTDADLASRPFKWQRFPGRGRLASRAFHRG